MEHYSYQVEIAGVIWCFDMPYRITIDENCAPFQIVDGRESITVRYHIGDFCHGEEMLIRKRAPRVWHGDDYYCIERRLGPREMDKSSLILRQGGQPLADVYIHPGSEEHVATLGKVIDLSEFEVMLAHVGALSLHSALIRYQKSAILFTAPSGTGKSTQAALWERFQGAEQLNGDRSIIRKNQQRWMAYGSPFAGTSGIFRNEYAPIRAIVILRQAEDNWIEKLSTADAFRCLYSETVIPQWHEDTHMKILDILTEIVTELPTFIFYCTPEKESVDVLNQYLQGEI